MRIVIDLQGAQAENRNRGIGRYSRSLAKAIIEHRDEHEIILVLNGIFPDAVEVIRQDLEGLLSRDKILIWEPTILLNKTNRKKSGYRKLVYAIRKRLNLLRYEKTWNRSASELLREAFLVSLNPDIVLVSSLFEGWVDNAATGVGMLKSNIPTAVILYDLIPLINKKVYLKNSVLADWYQSKISQLKQADIILSISESSRQEGIKYLKKSPKEIVNISTSSDAQFHQISIKDSAKDALFQRYNIRGSYVMYTGGIDFRKNIEGLIRAYSLLDSGLREIHQLLIVCSIQDIDRKRLELLAQESGLNMDELIFTGYVPEDDLISLYNLCKVFIFPSKHEGFGLPVLEAMHCGRAVIAANTSSLPEVVGNEAALFDPHSEEDIARKLKEVLSDDKFRHELERHGLKQAKKFSWEKTAKLAITAIENFIRQKKQVVASDQAKGLRLAYISPLPPARSGISDYSAELLPELAKHYKIDVILADISEVKESKESTYQVRSVEYFKENAQSYDRVLYHFGNSEFHQHMFDLIEEIPGVIVLHDFFLSGIIAHMEVHGGRQNYWAKELYRSHGYVALKDRFYMEDIGDVVFKYPCNFNVLQEALGVIVHSEYSCRLAESWYGSGSSQYWAHIPLLRVPALDSGQCERESLNLGKNDFVVCSFGLLGPTKLNDRLLDAWLSSALANDENCKLIFVGENNSELYGEKLLARIKKAGLGQRVIITGWADLEDYRKYLSIADVGVQLRTLSRGETSGTVLDCMNYGLATIVNANGSMADLNGESVCKLEDDFSDAELVEALEIYWENRGQCRALGDKGRKHIQTEHSPEMCAKSYAKNIERFYYSPQNTLPDLLNEITTIKIIPEEDVSLLQLAQKIDLTIKALPCHRQLFVDISELVKHDARSGIQRVVRNILWELLENPPNGIKIEPVYATEQSEGYYYARKFILDLLDCPDNILDDELISYKAGDIFLGLDLQPQVILAQRDFYKQLRRYGVQVSFIAYDLLCINLPEYFVKGAKEMFTNWLNVVAENDRVICISRAVAKEFDAWASENVLGDKSVPLTSWFHLGVAANNKMLNKGLSVEEGAIVDRLSDTTSFIMVGTVEPRKGHELVLSALEHIWDKGIDVNLVIVGKQGWLVDNLIQKINNHVELGRRLFWVNNSSDEYLEKLYQECSCLIAASEGEGFGLPLIEAAQQKMPIIARNIPVFREVAGDQAFYFSSNSSEGLAGSIEEWLSLYKRGEYPKSETIVWQSWQASLKQLLGCLNIYDSVER